MKRLIRRQAIADADIQGLTARIDAIELALCALLAAQPDEKGLHLLARLTNDFEEGGESPDVIAELDLLRGIVGGFHESLSPS